MSHRIFDGMTIDGHEVDTSRLKDTGKVYVGDEEWDPSDLITDEDIQEDFDETMLRTKEDLLKDIDSLLEAIETESQNDTKHSKAYYTRYTALVSRFRAEVERRTFPDKMAGWWAYSYDVQETGITLELIHYYTPDLNDEGYIDALCAETRFDLLHIKTKLLTVEQYAQAYEVTTTTVRQWIRRGKLRSAVKQGSEWRIPELAEVRDRGYQCVRYARAEFLSDVPEEYSFINDYDFIHIEQNKENKNLFTLSFDIRSDDSDEIKKHHKEMQVDTKEREKFELFLISNPFVSASDISIAHRG